MSQVVDWLAYAVLRLGETLVRALPPEAAMRLAEGLGTAWFWIDGRRRKRAAENLRVAFGAAENQRARRAEIRAVFKHLARTPVEQLAAAMPTWPVR